MGEWAHAWRLRRPNKVDRPGRLAGQPLPNPIIRPPFVKRCPACLSHLLPPTATSLWCTRKAVLTHGLHWLSCPAGRVAGHHQCTVGGPAGVDSYLPAPLYAPPQHTAHSNCIPAYHWHDACIQQSWLAEPQPCMASVQLGNPNYAPLRNARSPHPALCSTLIFSDQLGTRSLMLFLVTLMQCRGQAQQAGLATAARSCASMAGMCSAPALCLSHWHLRGCGQPSEAPLVLSLPINHMVAATNM